MSQVLRYVVLLLALPVVLNQVRKPTRWIGRPFLWLMNVTHSGLTDWGLSQVEVDENFSILDVGCGGGRTIGKLAAMAPEGRLYGVDYSAESVAASRATNSRLIREGRVEIRRASVSALPFPDGHFDLVTAVETHYYWPDLPHDMREILRVLKPGGTLIMIAESYAGGRFDKLQQPVMRALRTSRLSVDEHRALFAASGYSDVRMIERAGRGWICGIGTKPVC